MLAHLVSREHTSDTRPHRLVHVSTLFNEHVLSRHTPWTLPHFLHLVGVGCFSQASVPGACESDSRTQRPHMRSVLIFLVSREVMKLQHRPFPQRSHSLAGWKEGVLQFMYIYLVVLSQAGQTPYLETWLIFLGVATSPGHLQGRRECGPSGAGK